MNPEISITQIIGVVAPLCAILTFILHIIFAIAIRDDAEVLNEKTETHTYFIGAIAWAFVIIITGIFGVAIYWVMHHSTLRPKPSAEPVA